MKTYKVTYNGNASRFEKFESEINANSKRGAVEMVFSKIMDSNYFPQDDGSIKDCDGRMIAAPKSESLEYDGGLFVADEII